MPETLKIDGKLNVHIFCMTHTIFDGVADEVLLPAIDGNMMILKNRAPLFTSVRSGLMKIYNKGMPTENFYISEGVAEVRRNICSVIAWGVNANEIDLSQIHAQKEKLKDKLSKSHIDIQKKELQKTIDFLEMIEHENMTSGLK